MSLRILSEPVLYPVTDRLIHFLSRYAYAMTFATIITTILALSEYWSPSTTIQVAFLLVGVPLLLIVINFLGVWVSKDIKRGYAWSPLT